MSKKNTTKMENGLSSVLSDMVTGCQIGDLTEEELYQYFTELLSYAEVDSRIIVNVLEKFGELGRNQAMAIKVNEGC